MAEMTFACPLCNQMIAADEQWAGQQLQCPLCQGAIIAPGQPAGHPPEPQRSAGGTKLSAGQIQKPANPGRNLPVRNLTAAPTQKKSATVKYAVFGVVFLAAAVGGFYGFQWLSARQGQLNAKRAEAEKNSDGGQVGHIANLYNVLDATEPGRMGRGRGAGASLPNAAERGTGQSLRVPAGQDGAAAPAANPNLPLIPAVWTLDLAAGKIPEGRVNGSVAGTNFVPETVRVDPVGTAQVLRLIQGQPLSPDRELLVYLHLKPGETLGGQSLSIAADMKGSGVPQVAKRWKTNPRYAPQLKSFSGGYAMKLELGTPTNGVVPGKIFLALPDAEQSVVAGCFDLNSAVPDAGVQPVVMPVAAPAGTDPASAAYRKRYGLR